MHRTLLVVSLIAAAVGLATPANAAPSKLKTTTAEAFWYSRTATGPSSFIQTTWYVGVFATTEGVVQYSDLYQDVEDCVRGSNGHISCRGTSSVYGDTESPGTSIASFTMDF